MAPMKQSQLTPSTVVRTDLPFPVVDIEASKTADKLVIATHPTEKVVVESASELVDRSVQTSLFRNQGGENSPLDIVHDGNGQPMIFSIGSDGHLYCIFHADKASAPWQLLDITPNVDKIKSPVVGAFDILEVKQDLYFAVSLKPKPTNEIQEVHQVYWASIKLPKVEVDEQGKLQGFSTSELHWSPVKNNLGDRFITKLMCSPNPVSLQPGFTIFAATQTTATYLASAYAIDPSPDSEAPWTVITFGAQSNKIVDMQPVVLGGASGQSKRRAGLALLHDAPAPGHETEPVRRCNVVTLNDTRNEAFAQYSLNTSKVGKLTSMYTSFNSWGTHDVVVAGNGIAFHQFQNLNDPCLDKDGQVILPEIAFRQVFCKETMLANPRRYLLSILAVSEDDELYVIDGERDAKNFGLPTFKYSGLPIREDVAHIACHFNKELESMEFIYTTKKDNQISHLARDFQTSVVDIHGPSKGKPVPEGYPVSLTSEPIFVKINDLSYRLNRNRPTHVTADSMGQIEIVTAAPQQFGVSNIDVSLSKFSEKPFTFSVNMASRVMSVMSSVKTKDDLKRMTSETGQPLFDHVPDDKLEASAALLSQFDALKKTTESASNGHVPDAASLNSSMILATWSGTEAGVGSEPNQGEKSWLDKALDVAMEYVGDAIEFLRKVVKTAVKWAIKLVGPIVRIVIRIGSKILSFAVKTAVSLVRSLVGLLDNLLGTDMMGWLGLQFGKHIPNIQNRLKEISLGSLDVLTRFAMINRESLLEFFEDAEDVLFGDINDAEGPDAPKQDLSVLRFVRSIINSPIVKLILKFNPLAWIMEGMSEGLDEAFSDFKLPDFGPLAEAVGLTVKGLLEIGLGAFMELFSVISTSATDAFTNPKQLIPILIRAVRNCFKGAFAVTRDLALLVFDGLIRVISAIPAIITQAWKIPGLTDLWEDWIGQEFSLLNFATYGVAVFVDLTTVGLTDQQKSDAFGKPFGDDWTQFDIQPLYRGARRAAEQAALAAKYPGPSLPEHTKPIVMMVMVDGSGKEKDVIEDKEEEKEALQTGRILEELLNIVTGAWKLITLSIEVKEGWAMHAANKLQHEELDANRPLLAADEAAPVTHGFASGTWGACKVVAGVSTLGLVIWQNYRALQNATLANKLGSPNPRLIPSDAQMVGIAVAFAGCGIGMMVDGVGSVLTPSGTNSAQFQSAAITQKWFLGVGGTLFNVSCAAMTGLSPGCWSEPHWGDISQTFGSLVGAGTVVTTHAFSKAPWGPPAIIAGLVIDGTLTGCSIWSAAGNIAKTV